MVIYCEDHNNTVIDGIYDFYCVWVDTDQCDIENFTIRNGWYGIVCTSSENSNIQNNFINNTLYGIYLISTVGEYSINMSNISGSNLINNKIENNTLNNNYFGIKWQGNFTLVCNNTIRGDVGMIGIECYGNNNTIEHNNITNQQDDFMYGYGIYLYPGSYHNVIIGNTVTESFTGIYIDQDSNHTDISTNTITDNQNGIYVYGEAEAYWHITNVIFTDSFEDGDVSDWSIYDLDNSGYTWEISNTVPNWADLTYKNGTYFLMIDDDAAPTSVNNTDSAVTPTINCTLNEDVYLEFSIDLKNWIDYGEFWVNVSNDNGSTWTNVWYETNDNDTKVVLNISSIADGEEILINFTYDDNDDWAWGACIDEVIVGSSYQCTTIYDNLNTSINYNNIYDNVDYGLYYDSTGTSINASHNWWGDETGPYNSTSNPGGSGNSVKGPIDYRPWLQHYYPGVKNLNTGQTYTTIQDAINESSNVDIITIYEGTYYENIIIDKSLTLNAGSSPIIDGMNNIGINVEANNTTIQDIAVTNSSFGIKINNSLFTLNNVTLVNNMIYNNSIDGIFLHSSLNSNITQNQVYNNSRNGITLNCSSYNNITSNQFYNNTQNGLYIVNSSSYNIYKQNQISNHSSYGVYFNSSSENIFYHNNIINNNQQAYDDSNNTWYDTTLLNGNYWNDFNESSEGAYDNNSNGIVDTAYNLTSNQDLYPLVYPFENYYELSIIADSQVNENTELTVTIKSNGGTTISDAFVTFNGLTQSTDSNGQTTFTTPSVGSDTVYQITAVKTEYTGDSKTITVKNIDTGGGNGYGGYFIPVGDTTPPAIPSNVICITPETDNTPSFSWDLSTDSSGIAGYFVKIDDSLDTWIGNVSLWNSSNIIEDGMHTFYIKAKDASLNGNIGGYGLCSFIIDTSVLGNKPIANAGGPYNGLTYENLIFSGLASYDTDGTITNYTWNLGDGTIIYGGKITHSYNTPGVFNITLTIIDNDGLSNSIKTTVTIELDSDGDGWSDTEETNYNTNKTNPSDYPIDTDKDKLPDDYDEDDDNDGLADYLEKTWGSDPKNDSDVIIINLEGSGYYLIDSDKDGISDKFCNPTGRITTVEMTDDHNYLIDMDGDGNWDYIYNPASGEIKTYEKKSSDEFPWILILVGIVIAIIAIIIIFYFTGYRLWIEKY